MAHVGVKRFRAGERKEHAPHHREGDERIREHETRRLMRTERFEYFGRRPDIDGAEQCDHGEPADHDRAEQAADARGAAALHREQPDQDRERNRQDEVFERRRDELEALDGGKHGNGRRDDAVAIKQSGAHDAEQDQNRDPRTVGHSLHQGQQRRHQLRIAPAMRCPSSEARWQAGRWSKRPPGTSSMQTRR